MGEEVKVLLVEDELIIAHDLRMILQRNGYDVVGIADNGREALRLADLHSPFIIFMDINLKGDWDGIQTVSAIQSTKNSNVVYLTSSLDPDTLRRAKATKPYKVLTKFKEVEILDTMNELCSTD